MELEKKQLKNVTVWSLLLFLIMAISGCSMPEKLNKTINNTEKKPFVEHIKEKIAVFKSSYSDDGDLSSSGQNEVGNWRVFKSEEPAYHFKYPLSVSVNNQSKEAEFELTLNNLKIDTISASGTIINEDILILAKNIQNGTDDNFWGDSLEDARIIGNIQENGYREELFLDNGDCSLNFERKLVFYKDGYLVTLSLIAPADKIISENPDFFKTGPKECEEKPVWKYERQSEFYLMLKENRLSGTTQEWYNLFDLIKKSLSTQDKVIARNIVAIKEKSETELIRWPELDFQENKLINVANDLENIGGVKAAEKIKEADFFVNYNQGAYLSLTITGILKDNSKFLSYRNYNLNTDQIIKIGDLVKEEKMDDLVILVNIKLKENIKKYDIRKFADKSFSREDLENFSLTNEGIRFNFGEPSLSDKFTPELFAVFSYDNLRDYLKIQI